MALSTMHNRPPMSQNNALRTAVIICMIVISESLLATILFPFVYQMISRFDGVEDRQIGFWAGVINSTFFISQTLTAFLWGMLSDRLGRKPILIFGLLGGAVGSVMFGFSRHLRWAIAARAVCGLFNGNAAVTRTALGEHAYNMQWNQGKTFSLLGLSTAVGYIIGPLLGGFLSNPFTDNEGGGSLGLLDRFPYLLPCLFAGTYNIVVIAVSLVFLGETRVPCPVSKPPGNDPDESSALLADTDSVESIPEPLVAAASQSQGSAEGILSASVLSCVLGLFFLALHAVLFDEIYPIFASTPPPLGLGLSSSSIGLSLSVMGPIVLISALLLFPALNRRFTALSLWKVTATALAVVYGLFSLLPRNERLRLGRTSACRVFALLALMSIRFGANVVAYTCVGVLLNVVAPPGSRGAVMGLAQTAMSFGRSIGPALGGLIWSWSLDNGLPFPLDSHLIFLIQAVSAGLQFATSFTIVELK